MSDEILADSSDFLLIAAVSSQSKLVRLPQVTVDWGEEGDQHIEETNPGGSHRRVVFLITSGIKTPGGKGTERRQLRQEWCGEIYYHN